MPITKTTVTGPIFDATGTAYTNASVVFTPANYIRDDPNDTVVAQSEVEVTPDPTTGAFSIGLAPSDTISYSVSLVVRGPCTSKTYRLGLIYVPASGPVALEDLLPIFSPNVPTNAELLAALSAAIASAESSAADAAASAASVADDAAQTALDRIATAADVVLTGADVVSAEAAKDGAIAAVASIGVYADTTLAAAKTTGLAAAAEGETFHATGDDVDYIGVYKDLSGVATEQAQYPKATYARGTRSRLIAQETAFDLSDATRIVGKDTAPVSSSVSTTANTYMFTGRPAVAGVISAVSIFASAQTAKLKVYRATNYGTAYTMAYEVPLVITTGLNTFSVAAGTLGEYTVQEGDVVGIYVPTNIHFSSPATGADGYTAFPGDKSDAATFDNLGAAGTVELQASITIAAASSADVVKARAVDDTLSRTFSVGVLAPAAPSSLQYTPPGRAYAFDWVFKSASILTDVSVSSQNPAVAKIMVLEPYIGGYRVSRSVQIKLAAGVNSLAAGTDFPSDILAPKGGIVAIKAGTSNSIHMNVFNTLTRYRTFFGDATDGVFPSYDWPSGNENLSLVQYLSGAIQARFDFREVVDPVNIAAPQYIVREKFDAANGPVTMQGDAWTKGTGKMSSGATGIANALEWAGGHPHLTNFTCRWRFTFTASGSGVYLYKRPYDGSQGSLVGLDMTSGNIVVYNLFPETGTIPAAYSTTACTLTLVEDREYVATLAKNYRDWSITFSDSVTGDTQTISIDGDATAAAGFAYGVPGIATSAGTVDLTEFAAWSNRKAPNVLLFGDSITEGSGGTTIADTWAYKVSENGNGIASPRGGDSAASIVRRALYEINAFPSVRYAIFLMGTNDTNMTTWQLAVDNVAELCQTYGVVPVFGTLPPEAADTNPVLVQNPYIRSSGYRFIDFARALTTGGDGETRDAAKFADALHPNDAGHAAMFARVQLDLPEIFD